MRISDWSSDVCSSDLGDLLLIERSIDDGLLFRLTVISQTGPLFALVQPRTGGRRWGLLAGGTIPVPESEVDDALAEMEQRQATPFDPFDASLVYQPATNRIARSRAFRHAVIAAYGGDRKSVVTGKSVQERV